MKTAAHPFIEFHLKTIVIGSGLPQDASDDLNVGIVQRSLTVNAWRQSPGDRPVIAHAVDRVSNIHRLNRIATFSQKRMVESARARIPQYECRVGCELPLEVQIPLVYVVALNIVVVVSPNHLRRPHRGGERRNSGRPYARRRGGRARGTDCTVAAQEGGGRSVIEVVDVRLGQRIKYPKTASDRRLAIMEGIPGETNPRLEVLERGIAGVKLVDQVRGRALQRPQVSDFSV